VDVKGKINVPTNWELVPGQTIPDTVKATANGIPTVTVKVQPKMGSITDPAKLNKSISRTITINKPGEKPQVINQHADFTRTGQYNEVTGTTIYTDWALKDSTLEAVDAPAVPGYTPNVAHVDGVKNPTTDTKLNDVVINYTADDQNQVVNYVDQNGKVIKSDTITGKTDQTVDVNVKVPDHYELVNGQNIPENVTLKANNPVINIQVTPKMDDITAPSQLTKAISRTITINVPHQTPIVEKQSANFTRTGQHNEVTGEDVYTGWTLKDNSLRHVDVPAIPGYTPSQNTVDGIATPAVDTPVSDITVNYKANEQTGQITYVDEKGNQISSTPLTGKTDEDIAINPVAPAGWELVPGQKYPATVTATADGIPGVTLTVRHHMINVVPGDVPTPGYKKPGNNDKKPGDGTPNKDITHEDLNKTITRTFIVKAPTGTMTKTQHISYQRTATIDDVTGDVTFSDWNTDGASFKAEVIPAISGYTSHVTEGNYGAYAPSQDQINNWTDPMITVTYTANDQSQVINYVDDHNKTIKTDTVHGRTDETVNVTPSVPDHYELVPGQNIPSEVTLKDKNTPIIVKVQPKVDSITDPAKLNKSISRTITINKPGEKPQVINQTATFKRTGKTNEVTGITTYTPWVLDQNGLTTVSAPEVPGYTPSQKTVASVDNPTTNTKLTDVTINYTANSQTTHINYVDKDGETVKSDTVSGKTDETVKTNSEVPAGWKITDGQIPETIHFTGEETPDTTITIEHDTTSVDHIKPVKPGDKTPSGKVIDGAHESDLNQTITRTINVTTPDGQTTTTKQVAKIFRDATIDDVTGEVTYGSWSEDTWADFKPGQLAGYTASQADVPAVTVKDGQKDQTVDITYTANEGTVLIKYVDRDGNEIGQQVITGHVGDTIKVTPQFPENWVPVDPDTVPAEVQIKEENGQIIIVVVRHDEKDPVQTKKVTRTIMVTTPDGQTKTIKQVVTISRHGNLDLVTGQIAWQPWTIAQWDVFKPAAIAGYIPSLAEVPAVTVDSETTDQTVDITYAAVATPAQPEHQAPTASDTPDAQQATNQKADSNAQPAVTVVTSQQTATAQQAESTTNSRRLPQTGNSHDASALAGLGLASLMGLFGLGGKRRKRD
ncbi:mucin-binding protein, partial [Limosilactobacillus coleohominis]